MAAVHFIKPKTTRIYYTIILLLCTFNNVADMVRLMRAAPCELGVPWGVEATEEASDDDGVDHNKLPPPL